MSLILNLFAIRDIPIAFMYYQNLIQAILIMKLNIHCD